MRNAGVEAEAVAANFRLLAQRTEPLEPMAVVSGDAFGHGAVQAAGVLEQAGAEFLGTSRLTDAIVLRRSGVTIPIVAWQHAPGEDFSAAVADGVTPAVSTLSALEAALAAGARALHLVLETGCGQPGLSGVDWNSALHILAEAQRTSQLGPVGVMVQLPRGADSVLDAVATSLDEADAIGVEVGMVHAATHGRPSPALLAALLSAGITCLRSGAALFGLSEDAAHDAVAEGYRPALTLSAPVMGVKPVGADEGVSYGYIYRTTSDSHLALVPLGYGDGLDRAAGNKAPVCIGGRRYRIAGRVAMDAFVTDVGADPVAVGQTAVLFGDPAAGHPGAADWAAALGTTSAEIVTRLTKRVRRTWL